MIRDGSGLYGSLFNYAILSALFFSTLLVFVYLWRKGRLDMDEEAKWKMLEEDHENE